MNNKNNLMFVFSFLMIIIFMGGALGAISHCCEKTKVVTGGGGGAWCVDADLTECDIAYLMEPTACISTSYCALGTCVDRESGECMANTAQRACTPSKGFWSEGAPEDIPQCQLGCCSIGDQAAFVTQTKCKSFASLYSIDTHFQTNVQNEISCIASSFPDVKGACVFEREFETTCKMITKSACQAITDANFHEGFLCTADDLVTNCAVTDKTACVEERDEVFFLDSCGNVANVYDSSMITKAGGQVEPNGVDGTKYWTRITDPVCSLTTSKTDATANTADICGNCNYYEGSTCKKYKRGEDLEIPTHGDNVCRDLGCEFEGTSYLHGETWCANSSIAKGTSFLNVTGGSLTRTGIDNNYNLNNNLPGSRYFRFVCYNGDVTIEPCADRRAEVCIQSTRAVTGSSGTAQQFRSAVCRVNAWQTCTMQTKIEDCENSAERDCQWTAGGKCVPLVSPGFNFWIANNSDASDVCALASTTCVANYVKKIAGNWELEGDATCFADNNDKNYIPAWGTNQNQMCYSLGDCKGTLTETTSKATAVEIIKNYLNIAGN